MSILVADVGGTNTRVGVATDGRVDRARVARYRNADYAQLGDVLAAHLRDHSLPTPEAVCVAVAGPVRHGVGRLTNRDWIVSQDSICRVTRAPIGLVLNDLSAQGYAVDSVPVYPALPDGPQVTDPSETRLVIGIGTGFNAAPVFATPAGLMVVPSECGHVTLPVWDAASRRLSDALTAHHGFASVEDVLSGRGVSQSYRHLTGHTPPEDPGALMAEAEADPTSPAGQTIATLVGAIGRVTGDLALVHLPFGGIILIGGVARALVPFFDRFGFRAAMTDKGRFGEFLSQFGVFVLEDDFAALDGCALYALNTMKSLTR